jgi:carbon starvation protein
MPAVSRFVDGSGLVVPGGVFPFCFITIACGSISGFHALIASGITPKIITREGYARPIGYGAMLMESLVAIMAMIAACTMDPGIYLAMNVKGTGATREAAEAQTIDRIARSGFTVLDAAPDRPGTFVERPVSVSTEAMHGLAEQMGEHTLFGRTGGAATLAVGMAMIFSELTRVDGRSLVPLRLDVRGVVHPDDPRRRHPGGALPDSGRHPAGVAAVLGDTRSVAANVLASFLIVAGWGWFLIQGVRDPEGGIKALWPIFGIANQLLASIALCLATTLVLKMQLGPPSGDVARPRGRPVLAWITLVPLAWLLSVTVTAGLQKIFHENPRIGFAAAARAAEAQRPGLETGLETPERRGRRGARREAFDNCDLRTIVDTVVTGFFCGGNNLRSQRPRMDPLQPPQDRPCMRPSRCGCLNTGRRNRPSALGVIAPGWRSCANWRARRPSSGRVNALRAAAMERTEGHDQPSNARTMDDRDLW